MTIQMQIQRIALAALTAGFTLYGCGQSSPTASQPTSQGAEKVAPSAGTAQKVLSVDLNEALNCNIVDLSERDRPIATYLVKNMDDKGALTSDVKDIADKLGVPVVDVERILRDVQLSQ